MGVPSSPGHASPRAASRSMSFYLGAGLILPVTCLMVLWGVLTGLVLDGRLDKLSWLSSASPSQRALTGGAVIAAAGLIVVIAVVIRLTWLTRRLVAEVSRLTETASDLAEQRLPRVIAAVRNGEDGAQAAVDGGAVHQPDLTITEIAAASAAIADLYHAAAASAAAEAGLRNGFRQILVSLGRRNQSLLHRQLRIIDSLEQQAAHPAALADLFTLDHLTTRMRRHAESLTILSGAASGRSWSGPVPVIDVMRAAVAEVEDYTRVTVITDSDDAVAAPAVTDMIHLLAELIENATLFSPSSTRVEVRAERVANGFAIEVEDRGLGIPTEQLVLINAQLASPPDFDLADADRLGLFVAGRLAARHGVLVSLTPSPYRGTKAVVVLPDSIVTPAAEPATGPRTAVGAGAGPGAADLAVDGGRAARLNLQGAEVLSLAAGAGLPEPVPADAGQGATAQAQAQAQLAAAPADGGTTLDTTLDTMLGSALGAPDGSGDFPEVPAPTTINGLPRRVRPAGAGAAAAAAGPWDDLGAAVPSGEPAAPRHALPEGPAPEEARTLAASLQRSWHRSRHTAPDGARESEEE
ncbi:ATP-binding protein [Trebonia sp.]|uniref:sensor histidine kinase n=1 Tax=Trebonia sp. TaxID=2767075 RepID=UPI002622F55D|nr:ATP-binding protein [Trebonia sp.]